MKRLIGFFVLTLSAAAQPADLTKTVKAIGERCEGAREYAFEGELELLGQRGTAPAATLVHAKVKVAVAPEGKSYLKIEPARKDAYVLVSNGQKSWAWVPKLKQFTEDKAAAREEGDGKDDAGSGNERDLAQSFTRAIMPALAKLNVNVQGADFRGEANLKFEGRKRSWPLLGVIWGPDATGLQSLTEIAFDPATLAIGRLRYATETHEGGAKTVIQVSIDFSSFQIGAVDASTFEFAPPNGAKRVENLPLPGQPDSPLLNHPAPDFELKTLDGDTVPLADLHGHPVLLNFWATWCPPCRRELPGLAALNQEFEDRGLVILGVNDEGKTKARKYLEKAGLAFQTLDDSGSKMYHLYHVRSIPSVFLIDKEGKVVLFLRGSREPAQLRASLSKVGLVE